jgi:hypothetical protein
MAHRLGIFLLIVSGALIACAIGQGPTIAGRILDDRIEVATTRIPASVWLELENAGTLPCRLMVLDTLDPADAAWDPHALPIENGQVLIDTGSPVIEGRIHAEPDIHVEVDGQPLPVVEPGPIVVDGIEPAPAVRPGQVIAPGVTARVQLALIGEPREGAVRILVCDDPGDYERGRYAVLDFAR